MGRETMPLADVLNDMNSRLAAVEQVLRQNAVDMQKAESDARLRELSRERVRFLTARNDLLREIESLNKSITE